MRTFITLSHGAPLKWSLNNLSGEGRIDLLCRNIQAALFTSHGIRDDTQCIVVFPGYAVRIRGAAIQRLNPDERSTAARLLQALEARHDDPWWNEVQPGLDVAPYSFHDVIKDAGGTVVLLDPDGTQLRDAAIPENPVFLMSDHKPFEPEDLDGIQADETWSLGPEYLHGNQVIHVIQWWFA